MNALREHKVLFIIGPTAVGKTEISLQIAKKIDCEIVSADSRQVYRYMNIGTAKPTPEEQKCVRHHFIDCRDPDQYFSAGEYGRKARARIKDIHQRGKYALVTGGAGFYIQALVDGLFAPGYSDISVKEKWRQAIHEQGREQVFETLKHIDPVTAGRLHPNDTQRIVRALEVYELTGNPISQYRAKTVEPAEFTPLLYGLYRKRKHLYARIDQRVDQMLEQGLLEEVRSLKQRGYTLNMNALRTVGYQEVFHYLDDKISFKDMVEQIKTNSRRYAKRQLTWFRKDNRIQWMDLDQVSATKTIDIITNHLFEN